MTCDLSDGPVLGLIRDMPLVRARVQITCVRVWESGFRPGIFVCAMPFTTTKGIKARPIKLLVVKYPRLGN